MRSKSAKRARRIHIFWTFSLMLGWLAASSQAAGTTLHVAAVGTGTVKLNDGTLMSAKHVGNAGDGMQAASSVTLAAAKPWINRG